ncbi:MAG: hypothetical protein J7K62_01705 [Thermoplasmata archaeon]|nr:hypothetical protein [Thermoplasmata archaeon]
MKIKVNPKNIDTSEKYLYRARTTEIKVSSSRSIMTPIRAVTNSEMRAKQNIPTEIPIDAEIGNITIKLTSKRTHNVASFINKNSAYNTIKRKALYQLLSMQYSLFTYVLLQPTKEAIQFLHKTNQIEEFSRLQSILQAEDLNLDVITIPWLELPPQQFIRLHKRYVTQFPDKEIIPFIDPKNERYLPEILTYLSKNENTDTVNIVGILYRPCSTHRISYDRIWKTFYDKDIGIILTDVSRTLLRDLSSNVSGVHYSEFFIGDILSSFVGIRAPLDSEGEENSKEPIEHQLKFFRKEALDVLPLFDLKKVNPHWIDKIISEIGEKSIRTALENYKEAENSKDKKDKKVILYSISKLHEFKESRQEFKISQKYIKQTDSIDYIKEKEALREIFLRQTKL